MRSAVVLIMLCLLSASRATTVAAQSPETIQLDSFPGSQQPVPAQHDQAGRSLPSDDQPSIPASPSQDEPRFAAVDACLQQEMRDKSIPGASMAIAMDGALAHTSAFGLRRADAPERVDSQTIFRINSTTKMMAAAAVMREVEAGRLDLHAPITRYVPELRLKPPWDASSLNLHFLLANAGGLPDPYLDFEHMPLRYDMPEHSLDLTAWARGFAKMHLYAPPGSFWNYSSPNFSLAGLAVERTGGQQFEDYVTEHLWRPAGMRLSTFDPEAVVASGNYAVGHALGQFWEPGSYQRIYAAPGGGAYSTPSELILWAGQLLEEGGAILAPSSVEAMTTPYFEAEDLPWSQRSQYAYGIFVDDYRRVGAPAERLRVLRHPGNGRGYGTEFVWVPELEFAFVALFNNYVNMQRTVDCALRELVGLEPAPIPELRTPASSWNRYTGSYVVQNAYGARWTARISLEGDQARIDYPDWMLAPAIAATYPAGAPLRQRHLDSFAYSIAGDQSVTFEPGGADAEHSGWMRNRYFVGQRVGELPARVDIEGWGCASLDLVAGLVTPVLNVRAYGLVPPRVWRDDPISQDDPDDPASSRIKIDLDLGGPLGYLNAWLFEEADDNLELYLMQDMDGDGEYRWPEELVERLTAAAAQGMFVPAREEAGAYQLWVHGQQVSGVGSRFDLDLVAIPDVGGLRVEGRPGPLRPGDATSLEVCARADRSGDSEILMQDLPTLSVGIVELDFGSPGAVARVPVYRLPGEAPEPSKPRIYLPLTWRER